LFLNTLVKRIFIIEIFNTLQGGEEASTPRTTTRPLNPVTYHRGDGKFSRKENEAWQRKKSPGHPKLRLRYTGGRKT
jgi:hypothetical protein